MREKEFKILLKKYIKGTLSEEEKELLEKFNERLRIENKEPNFQNKTHKNQLKESIWSEISIQTKSKTKYLSWKIVASVAAIFIGLLATSYLYLQIGTTSSESFISKDAITLELEDGSIKIIKEDGNAKILDTEGRVIGKQNRNKLVYKELNYSKKLAYNKLIVPYGKTFELKLSDGTKVHLNSGSSLRYPTQFLKEMDRQVYVTGEAFIDVVRDSDHPFIVHTDNLNVRVLGTKFNVYSYPEDDTTEIVLVEGLLSLYADSEVDDYNDKNSTKLESGFKASFDKRDKSITKEVVITNIYTSWMEGEQVFRNMSFENILKKLERHYNVIIINKNKELSKVKFSASFGKVSIEKVFENLKIYHSIDYEIKDNIIMIK